ncbi:hypothetical protein BGZ63DRAFT_419592 [Mariannaea sp. PMI_226]|nr:hypothetical protein BGZ63DRAFT_419592 [Mariannaea sp. PMI_226]
MEVSRPRYSAVHTSEAIVSPRALIAGWNTTPFGNLTVTTSGLVALADLRIVANRTAIRGGSSWIDAIVLAPGLHYQQACDYLDRETPTGLFATPVPAATDGQGRYEIRNNVMANYVARLSRQKARGPFILEIGAEDPWKIKRRLVAMFRRGEKTTDKGLNLGLIMVDWLSHLLFLLSPVFTIFVLYMMVLFEDIWGVCLVVALIISRLLNIWAIKNRTEKIEESAGPLVDHSITEYSIDLGGGTIVRLRGQDADLQAVTTKTWVRAQSVLDGYLEAVAKMMVYLVAGLSGNMTQVGALTFMALLLVSAMLLGLSNAHAKGIRIGGRYAILETDRWRSKSQNGRLRSAI